MAWLLFLDESGHDHKQMPYEVRGGVALQDAHDIKDRMGQESEEGGTEFAEGQT